MKKIQTKKQTKYNKTKTKQKKGFLLIDALFFTYFFDVLRVVVRKVEFHVLWDSVINYILFRVEFPWRLSDSHVFFWVSLPPFLTLLSGSSDLQRLLSEYFRNTREESFQRLLEVLYRDLIETLKILWLSSFLLEMFWNQWVAWHELLNRK